MALPAGTTVINGFALTPDGALYVTLGSGAAAGQAAAAALGFPFVLAKSGTGVSAPADTTEDILATVTVPANAMGANGQLWIRAHFVMTSSGNLKTVRIRYSGIGGTIYGSGALTTTASLSLDFLISNLNATNSQMSNNFLPATPSSSTNVASTTSAVDTTASSTIVFTGQKATAGETITLQMYSVLLLSNGT